MWWILYMPPVKHIVLSIKFLVSHAVHVEYVQQLRRICCTSLHYVTTSYLRLYTKRFAMRNLIGSPSHNFSRLQCRLDYHYSALNLKTQILFQWAITGRTVTLAHCVYTVNRCRRYNGAESLNPSAGVTRQNVSLVRREIDIVTFTAFRGASPASITRRYVLLFYLSN